MPESREPPALLIYTDASYTQHGAAWGAVIRGLGAEIERGGAFKQPCPSSDLAELWGVANALHIAIADGRLKHGVTATVLCDNIHAVNRLNGKCRRSARRLPYTQAADLIHKIVSDIRADVSFEWVKGHQTQQAACPHRDGNCAADRLARKHNVAGRKARLEARKRRREEKAMRNAQRPQQSQSVPHANAEQGAACGA